MLERATLPRPLEVFVKVNTGMNRLGFSPSAVAGVCERLGRSPSVAAIRLMTHLARADEDDGPALDDERREELQRIGRQLEAERPRRRR